MKECIAKLLREDKLCSVFTNDAEKFMAGYLLEKGVPRGQIFLEDKSASTRENLRFSRKYADAERDKVGIVTNDFHIYRSSLIARQEGYRNIYLIPADSNPVFQLNYLVREFFGVIQVCLFH